MKYLLEGFSDAYIEKFKHARNKQGINKYYCIS